MISPQCSTVFSVENTITTTPKDVLLSFYEQVLRDSLYYYNDAFRKGAVFNQRDIVKLVMKKTISDYSALSGNQEAAERELDAYLVEFIGIIDVIKDKFGVLNGNALAYEDDVVICFSRIWEIKQTEDWMKETGIKDWGRSFSI